MMTEPQRFTEVLIADLSFNAPPAGAGRAIA